VFAVTCLHVATICTFNFIAFRDLVIVRALDVQWYQLSNYLYRIDVIFFDDGWILNGWILSRWVGAVESFTWEVDALLLVDAEDLASGALLDHWHQRALLGDASVVVFAEMLRAIVLSFAIFECAQSRFRTLQLYNLVCFWYLLVVVTTNGYGFVCVGYCYAFIKTLIICSSSSIAIEVQGSRSWRFVVAGEELNTFVSEAAIVADWFPLALLGVGFASGFNSFRDTEISRTFSIIGRVDT